MRYFKIVIALLLFAVNFCNAQDKPVVISAKMFEHLADFVRLGHLDGWYFRPGNDTTWAKTDINMTGWVKLRPLDLSPKYVDKNGKVEGWFRIKIKLDSTVKKKGLNINYSCYAPADIYVDGKHIGSAGNTGLYGRPYSEYRASLFDPSLPISKKSGEQFTLALHLVDTLSPLPLRRLKMQITQSGDIIFLGSAATEGLVMADYINYAKSVTLWLSVTSSLSLLFWLLVVQNRKEKVFIYVAGFSTFFVLFIYSVLSQADFRAISSSAFIFYVTIQWFAYALILVSIPVLLAEIFKRKLFLWLKITLAIIAVYGFFASLLPFAPDIPINVCGLILMGISIYYIISSWKNLHGAQWSVVAGLFAALLFAVIDTVAAALFPGEIFADNGVGYFLLSGGLLSVPLSLLVFVAMRFKEMLREVRQHANEVIRLSEEKKEEALNRQKLLQAEVDRQTAEIRANQARLIQSEKMASLGELTAGIAHEIQNPLNFVNNFSEVNREMLEELEIEIKNGNTEDALALTSDIIKNEEKIAHHGKRADGIVKGMLEHSRSRSGQKEPTDLNAMAAECMRISYHGLREKDKSFNAELITHFDASLPKIEVVQQDISRVLLNLFNNAFYAVKQKQKTQGSDYKPEVSVSSYTESGLVIIKVKDNGIGIPDAIKDKIMQPFFTTKPTGEGTGLGLSLTYDMVVKGHGGSIQVNSVEGEGSEFIISLPVN